MNRVDSFKGEFGFLNNSFLVSILYDGDVYKSVEHAFQAARTLDREERRVVRETSSPEQAREIGQTVTLRPAWDDIKLNVMRDLLWQKFTEHPGLRAKLLATEDAELVE